MPEFATFVTHAFLHADWLHLGGNMLFLWVFGDNIEDAIGHVRYLVFYLACAVLAGLTYSFMAPTSSAAADRRLGRGRRRRRRLSRAAPARENLRPAS